MNYKLFGRITIGGGGGGGRELLDIALLILYISRVVGGGWVIAYLVFCIKLVICKIYYKHLYTSTFYNKSSLYENNKCVLKRLINFACLCQYSVDLKRQQGGGSLKGQLTRPLWQFFNKRLLKKVNLL